MPVLTNAQLVGLAARDLGAGTELDNNWTDPYPDAPCWGWALFGGPGGHADNTPPVIFEHALVYNQAGVLTGLDPGFCAWVAGAFPNDQAAQNQAAIISQRFDAAMIDLDPAAQSAVRDAFARLCITVSGLTLAAGGNYQIVMASDNWYTWEHWALGLANDIDAAENPPVQYTQRDAGVNPVNTRCEEVWGDHPLLTTVHVQSIHQGHIDYLRHAAGWPTA